MLRYDLYCVPNRTILLILCQPDRYNDLLEHTRRNDTVLLLLNDDSLVTHRLDGDMVGNNILVLDGHRDFIQRSWSNVPEDDRARHYLQGAFKRVMQHTCHHAIGLVDKLTKGLLLVDGAEDHLVLALFAHIFN